MGLTLGLGLLLQAAAGPQSGAALPPVSGYDVPPPAPTPAVPAQRDAVATECAVHYGFAAFITLAAGRVAGIDPGEGRSRADQAGAAYQARARFVLARAGRLNPFTDLPQDVLDRVSGQVDRYLAGDSEIRAATEKGVAGCDGRYGFASLPDPTAVPAVRPLPVPAAGPAPPTSAVPAAQVPRGSESLRP